VLRTIELIKETPCVGKKEGQGVTLGTEESRPISLDKQREFGWFGFDCGRSPWRHKASYRRI
jgi:hypothetical protein